MLSASVLQIRVMSRGKRGTVERTKDYLTKPSTHVGIYAAGCGALIGMSGGTLKGVYDALYVEGPLIAEDVAMRSWQGAGYHFLEAADRVFATSAAFAEAGTFVGYAGGSLVTDRVLGYASSFLKWIFGGSK
jgi:hypothetical protein